MRGDLIAWLGGDGDDVDEADAFGPNIAAVLRKVRGVVASLDVELGGPGLLPATPMVGFYADGARYVKSARCFVFVFLFWFRREMGETWLACCQRMLQCRLCCEHTAPCVHVLKG